ncbi:putative transcription elongation factor B polypeptide 1 [Heterostelium album PN500]|uniref:Elongin-C n=1 Tax=Heterostelium pallidum (strain ATCC 26659 / Pp 5 / PN500) TaxID=670386 RepID=D3BEF4_HETP5|nr:putative transcription elongation factor B polypeptide 1 [Heterostelium album PN500]EFA80285.1 putative transcription elongation factor B polypeptide 1 [Heterostelium album PN500]|eukprot:XP_020432405.1 putative transcription elongation factor B polypeptide 1 [Heterostelium album PN500]
MTDNNDSDFQSDILRLYSSTGHEFVLSRKMSYVSGTIKSMLGGGDNSSFMEDQNSEIRFREISTPVLEKVIQYFYFKNKYTNSTTDLPEFPINDKIVVDLLLCAHFLDT